MTLEDGMSKDHKLLLIFCGIALTIGISMFSYFALNYDTSPDPLYYDYVPNEETKNIG